MVMAQTQDAFEIYQIVFVFLNLIVFLPCCLLISQLARPRKFGILPLAGIFALSPVMMVNATYTGAKSFAAFFAVTAVALYLRGWKKRGSGRMVAAFVCAAGGAVAHYSAVPYALFLGLHYLVAVFPRRQERVKELASIAGAAAVPLLAWFGWCVATFGFAGSFMPAVNTSVGYKYNAQESYLLKTLANLFDAIVPHPLRDWALVQAWGQPNTLGYLRDNLFLTYQVSLVFTLGLVGGPLVWWLVFRALRRYRTPVRTFWLALIPFAIAACFVLAGERDYFGQAHIVLISMMAIGLTLLAANFTRRRAIALAIVAGCAVDFSLGIFLQTRVEHLENTPTSMPFTRIQVGPTVMDIAPANADTLSRVSGGNWFRKHQYALAEKWLRGLATVYPDGRGLTPAQISARDALSGIIRQDATMFGGWYKRHQGELTFFGDHFGDSDFTSLLLLAGAAALLFKLARYAPRAMVAPQAAARSGRGAAIKSKPANPRKK
jgi:4-amino-4-deoxy-L-arabinose transferase-like glycosyltransferase